MLNFSTSSVNTCCVRLSSDDKGGLCRVVKWRTTKLPENCVEVDVSPCAHAVDLVAYLGNGQHHQRGNEGH